MECCSTDNIVLHNLPPTPRQFLLSFSVTVFLQVRERTDTFVPNVLPIRYAGSTATARRIKSPAQNRIHFCRFSITHRFHPAPDSIFYLGGDGESNFYINIRELEKSLLSFPFGDEEGLKDRFMLGSKCWRQMADLLLFNKEGQGTLLLILENWRKNCRGFPYRMIFFWTQIMFWWNY